MREGKKADLDSRLDVTSNSFVSVSLSIFISYTCSYTVSCFYLALSCSSHLKFSRGCVGCAKQEKSIVRFFPLWVLVCSPRFSVVGGSTAVGPLLAVQPL